MRAVAYRSELPGFIDSYYPDRDVRKDVNGGSRTGGRLAFRFEPTENFTITPRVVYQKLETDGYPRIDVYNILGNPYTTTEPPVDPGERGQVTQLPEGLTDDFTMGDLKLDFGFGDLGITSVTTYIDRQVEVLRDASQLTGSVTFDVGGTAEQVRLDSPLIDETDMQVFSQELRLASTGEGAFQWLVGAFYQTADRDYAQTLPTPGYDDSPAARHGRARRHALLLTAVLRFPAVRGVRRSDLSLQSAVGAHRWPAVLRFRRRPRHHDRGRVRRSAALR